MNQVSNAIWLFAVLILNNITHVYIQGNLGSCLQSKAGQEVVADSGFFFFSTFYLLNSLVVVLTCDYKVNSNEKKSNNVSYEGD